VGELAIAEDLQEVRDSLIAGLREVFRTKGSNKFKQPHKKANK
jgi:hypothetical protein